MNTAVASLRLDVACACRVLWDQGLVDASPVGHVSARIPDTEQYLVTPFGVFFDELCPADVLRIDGDGNVLEGGHPVHPGTVIHLAIHRVRRDIGAIVHTHARYTTALSLLGVPIEPFDQRGAAIHGDQAIYEDFTGPVRTLADATPIATALGSKSVAILKNHGLITVGRTPAQALWDTIVTESAAKTHFTALQIGIRQAPPLPAEFLQKSAKEIREIAHKRMWEVFLRRLRKSAPALFTEA